MLFLITGCRHRLLFNTVKTRVDDKPRSRGQVVSGSGAFKCDKLRSYQNWFPRLRYRPMNLQSSRRANLRPFGICQRMFPTRDRDATVRKPEN